MKTPLVSFLAAVLCAAPLAAGTLPVPQFLLRATEFADGKVPLALPEGTFGEATGGVTGAADGIVFSEGGGTIEIPVDAASLFGDKFTVTARLEPHQLNGHGTILDANAPVGFGVALHAHGGIAVSAGGSGHWRNLIAPKTVLLGSTQSIAVVFDGQEATIYVDGTAAAKGEIGGTPAARNSIKIGGVFRTTEGGELADVPLYRLEEVAVFTEALTPEQISALANGTEIPTK